jgi:hypothetical protein
MGVILLTSLFGAVSEPTTRNDRFGNVIFHLQVPDGAISESDHQLQSICPEDKVKYFSRMNPNI